MIPCPFFLLNIPMIPFAADVWRPGRGVVAAPYQDQHRADRCGGGLLAVLSVKNPFPVFANATATLIGMSDVRSAPAPTAPAAQAAASVPALRRPAEPHRPAPTRDEIARRAQGGPSEPGPGGDQPAHRQLSAPVQLRCPPRLLSAAHAMPASKKARCRRTAMLMTRAKGLLATGDIPPARLLLERAADAQEPSAALMLAQTYDPACWERRIPATSTPIRRWRATGISAPPNSARPMRSGVSVNCNNLFQPGETYATFNWNGTRCHDDGPAALRPAPKRPNIDPAKVSDSLKAIFQFGSAATKQALNANTVTLISGTIGGTYVQFGADLASVLDDGNKLRVLPIVGRGSVQSVADILFLQGVDLGIVRADTLDYLERKGFAKDIKKQFTYVTKLYNEEMQVIAPKSVQSLKDLEGKTVSVDLPNGGTFVTVLTVFDGSGSRPNCRLYRAAHRDGEAEERRDRRRHRRRRQALQVGQPASAMTAASIS